MDNMRGFYVERLKHIVSDDDALAQVQRAAATKTDDFLWEAGRYLSILKPPFSESRGLLNLGSGNGLLNLVLARFYGKVVAIDPTPEMMATCKTICRNLKNITYVTDYGQNIGRHLSGPSYDDIVSIGIATVLKRNQEYFDAIAESAKFLRRPGKVLIGELCDSAKRDAYLGRLPGILQSKGFNPDRIAKIVADNADANWVSESEYWSFFQKLGAKRYARHEGNLQHVGHECQFDLLVEF